MVNEISCFLSCLTSLFTNCLIVTANDDFHRQRAVTKRPTTRKPTIKKPTTRPTRKPTRKTLPPTHKGTLSPQCPTDPPTADKLIACQFVGIPNLETCFNFGILNTFPSGRIPTQLGLLTNLISIGFINNVRGTLPSTIGCLTKLTYLRLWKNQLNGTIPSSIGSLTKLKYL
jgi:hypothetical protein